MRTKFKKAALAFLKDESGQSLTEYALLMFFIIVAVKTVGTGLKDQLQSLVNKAFKKAEDGVE